MIKSMTGYGSASGTVGKLDVTIELRSVNNRYLDCNIRMPRIYNFAEDAMKACIQKSITRGKVDVFVTVDSSKADDVKVTVNEPLLAGYLDAFKMIESKFGIRNDVGISMLSRIPDVLTVEKEETDADAFTAEICGVLNAALADFDAMRTREGSKLRDDMYERLSEIRRLTDIAKERSPRSVEEYRARLTAKMQEVLEDKNIDESRILTEAAIFADRVDVNEETVRLYSHMDQLKGMLDSSGPIGRKMDFLVQEFNREANTLGSKCNDLELSQVVVDLKAEIEKVREQCQNVE